MDNLNFYYKEFIIQTNHYKRKPGFNRTYKKLLDITGNHSQVVAVLTSLMGYDAFDIKYHLSTMQSRKRQYQKQKLNIRAE